jgi:uncharacterized protein YdaL
VYFIMQSYVEHPADDSESLDFLLGHLATEMHMKKDQTKKASYEFSPKNAIFYYRKHTLTVD